MTKYAFIASCMIYLHDLFTFPPTTPNISAPSPHAPSSPSASVLHYLMVFYCISSTNKYALCIVGYSAILSTWLSVFAINNNWYYFMTV